jgi:hypothetical protein
VCKIRNDLVLHRQTGSDGCDAVKEGARVPQRSENREPYIGLVQVLRNVGGLDLHRRTSGGEGGSTETVDGELGLTVGVGVQPDEPTEAGQVWMFSCQLVLAA